MNSIDRFINDIDLERFNLFLQGDSKAQTYYNIDNLPPLHDMFPDHVYYAILHKKNPGTEVGHWVLLIKWDDQHFEYFDCLGHQAPQALKNALDDYSELYSLPINLTESGRVLMGKNNFICGKWVIFRLMCIPKDIRAFYKFFDTICNPKKGLTPDSIVNFVVNIPFKYTGV